MLIGIGDFKSKNILSPALIENIFKEVEKA
jgi:hypothetical protein